jgi:selenocysteine-specific elongation factor
MPHIIGTAGHIDHGKTALIKALTGHETDRLQEEQERGISIELGFAYLDLPNGERAGIIDVPGHERFIRNMLAGAHGIDLVLFTVAADDGVMPQSEEHLDFLHLLGVQNGIFVITKADLVDADRLADVHEEIEILTLDTTLEGAPIIPVSSITGHGLDALRDTIATRLTDYERPSLPGYFRLPVDRAFVMKGHGIVVTGTAIAGSIRGGDTVRLLPSGEETRIRSVQVHGESVSEASWGQRVALNLVGLEKSAIARGHVVCHPKVTRTTQRFDAWVEIRPGAKREVENHERVRVHVGTAEVIGKIILLNGQDVLAPRSTSFCQIVLDEPVVALRGDRFILRNQTAQGTLGGGEVLNPFATRHRRSKGGMQERLAPLRTRDLLQACRAYIEVQPQFAAPLEEIYQGVNAQEHEVAAVLVQDPDVLPLPNAQHPEAYSVITKWQRLTTEVDRILAAFHQRTPLAQGMEMESVRSQLSFAFSPKLFRAVTDKLAAEGVVVREESSLRLPSHTVTLSEDEQATASRLQQALDAGGLTPPEMKEIEATLGLPRKQLADLLGILESQQKVVKVTTDLYIGTPALDTARTVLIGQLSSQGEISAATFRDLLGISRKTAIPLLEYFDRIGLTLRVGDVRKLRKAL